MSVLLRERGRSLAGLVLILALAAAVMALRSEALDPSRVVGGTLILLSFAMGPLMVGGLVSEDLRSGAALLWLQKPVSPVAFYLRRLAVALGTAVGAITALLLLGVLALTAAGVPGGGRLFLLGPLLAGSTGLTAVVTFAFSSTGASRDGTLAFLYLLLAVPASLILELAQGRAPVVRALAWLCLFPLNELQLLQEWIGGGSGGPPGQAVLRLAVYALAWLAAGSAALARSTSRPFRGGTT